MVSEVRPQSPTAKKVIHGSLCLMPMGTYLTKHETSWTSVISGLFKDFWGFTLKYKQWIQNILLSQLLLSNLKITIPFCIIWIKSTCFWRFLPWFGQFAHFNVDRCWHYFALCFTCFTLSLLLLSHFLGNDNLTLHKTLRVGYLIMNFGLPVLCLSKMPDFTNPNFKAYMLLFGFWRMKLLN